MKCEGCGVEVNVVYMCDEAEVKNDKFQQFCGTCFDKTDCGRGLHEEGCETKVIESAEAS